MRYLCLIFARESIVDLVPAAELASIEAECHALEDALRGSRQLVAAETLMPAWTATTVRVRNNRILVSDGPSAETQEQLAGFYLIEARDLNDAIRIAARIPPARLGGIEIRAVRIGLRPRGPLPDIGECRNDLNAERGPQ